MNRPWMTAAVVGLVAFGSCRSTEPTSYVPWLSALSPPPANLAAVLGYLAPAEEFCG